MSTQDKFDVTIAIGLPALGSLLKRVRNKALPGITLGIAAMTSIAFAPSAFAGDVHSVSANIALTSDYRFRSIAQSSEDPAVSGGFDYSYNPLGVYLGVWASSIEFNGCGAPCTDSASMEIDFYGGIAGELPNGVGWDVGAIYYAYPSQNEEGTSEFDFVEVNGSVSYTFSGMSWEPTIGASVAYSPDFFGETGDAYYFNGSLDLALPAGFSIGAELGWQDVQNSGDYVHWRVGLGYEYKALAFDLSYHDAESDCQLVSGAASLCDGTVVFTVSSSFDLF